MEESAVWYSRWSYLDISFIILPRYTRVKKTCFKRKSWSMNINRMIPYPSEIWNFCHTSRFLTRKVSLLYPLRKSSRDLSASKSWWPNMSRTRISLMTLPIWDRAREKTLRASRISTIENLKMETILWFAQKIPRRSGS